MFLLLCGAADIAPDSSSSLAEGCFRAEGVGRKGRVGAKERLGVLVSSGKLYPAENTLPQLLLKSEVGHACVRRQERYLLQKMHGAP